MKTATPLHYQIQGETFGARGCPSCTCNPDDYGKSANNNTTPNHPAWRVSGYAIERGKVQDIDISKIILLSLSQPTENGQWQEVILIDQKATDSQIVALLEVFEDHLDSIPAEVESHLRQKRAIYRVPMTYTKQENQPMLNLSFSPDTAVIIRESAGQSQTVLKPWTYRGPMALRETFERRR